MPPPGDEAGRPLQPNLWDAARLTPDVRLGVALATSTSGPDRNPDGPCFRRRVHPRVGGETRSHPPRGYPDPDRPLGTRGAPEDPREIGFDAWLWVRAMDAFIRFANQSQGRDRLFR